jgi:hypothetical protein
MVAETRRHGLSLDDRACLALGLALKAPVYMADKSWKKLKVGAHSRHPRRGYSVSKGWSTCLPAPTPDYYPLADKRVRTMDAR